jgi:mRNA interferase MazF
VRRGEVWTVSGGSDYAGKPRPAVILQDDSFDATDSITICAFTTDPTDAPLFRFVVEPNERNGLRSAGRLMVDKITTVSKTKLGAQVGRLDDEAQSGDDRVPRYGGDAEGAVGGLPWPSQFSIIGRLCFAGWNPITPFEKKST